MTLSVATILSQRSALVKTLFSKVIYSELISLGVVSRATWPVLLSILAITLEEIKAELSAVFKNSRIFLPLGTAVGPKTNWPVVVGVAPVV